MIFLILFNIVIISSFCSKFAYKHDEKESNPLHNPALLQVRMNLEPMAAINTSLDAARNLFRISLLPVLALRTDNDEHHAFKEAE